MINSPVSNNPALPEKGDVLPTGPHKPKLMAAIARLLDFIKDRPLDAALEKDLNDRYGATTEGYAELLGLLRIGINEGWACYAEIDGPDYRRGRLAKPSGETHGFSVETGMLKDVLGNYHRHPLGEINMIGPVDVYLVAHHGGSDAAEPATFAAFRPRVSILNNGATKGGAADMFTFLHQTNTWYHFQLFQIKQITRDITHHENLLLGFEYMV